MWKSNTGLPVFAEAARASSNEACQATLPGWTLGLATVSEAAEPAFLASNALVGFSIRLLGVRTGTGDPAFEKAPAVDEVFHPYKRDANLARPWAIPGTPGLEHRIGGLEKQDLTGNISYDPSNHEQMTLLRAAKVAYHEWRHPRPVAPREGNPPPEPKILKEAR